MEISALVFQGVKSFLSEEREWLSLAARAELLLTSTLQQHCCCSGGLGSSVGHGVISEWLFVFIACSQSIVLFPW